MRPVPGTFCAGSGEYRVAALEVHTPRSLRGSWLSHTTLATTVMATQPQFREESRGPGPFGPLAECEVPSGRRAVDILVLSPDYPSPRIPLLARVTSSTRVTSPGRGGLLSSTRT